MFLESTNNIVPEWFSQMCSLRLTNTRTCYAEIIDIVESDLFLKVYMKDLFKDFLKKGGSLGMLTALGPHGFRNRLAESILVHASEGHYPQEVEGDYIQDLIDLEKRFDFLSYEDNSRIFLMGMFFKLSDINNDQELNSLINVPIAIDELLKDPKGKSDRPDWLVITLLLLRDLKGEGFLSLNMPKHHGDIKEILALLSDEETDQFLSNLLKYAQSTHSAEFFHTSKVD